jgi:hypothetical protein
MLWTEWFMVISIGVIEFDETVESRLGVRVASAETENLIGRGYLVRRHGVWPWNMRAIVRNASTVGNLGVGSFAELVASEGLRSA